MKLYRRISFVVLFSANSAANRTTEWDDAAEERKRRIISGLGYHSNDQCVSFVLRLHVSSSISA